MSKQSASARLATNKASKEKMIFITGSKVILFNIVTLKDGIYVC